MQVRLQHLLFAALIIGLVSLSYGLNFVYYSDIEMTRFGERIKFWHGDTLCGPVRSNDQISIMLDPQFCDYVITSSPDFWRGSGYNPGFTTDYPPFFNAPRLEFPQSATRLRQEAMQQNHYFNGGDSMMARVHIQGDSLQIWWTLRDTPFDTSSFSWHTLPPQASVFFDCPIIHVWGTVSTTLLLGVAGRAGLEDNLLYASSDQNTGQLTPGHAEKFALIAEEEIKILNTWPNGRENSHARGNNQTNLDSTSVLLNGFFFALNGEFTFDQQNDADSGYVCTCQPDDRGVVRLWGGLAQHRRGYVHRSTRTSTGYLKNYSYDNDLRFWDIGVFNVRENVIEPTAVNFGNVAVGDEAHATVNLFNDYVPVAIDSIVSPPQFLTDFTVDTFRWVHPIPLSFAPDHAGIFDDSIRIYIGYYQRWYSVAVSGVGLALGTDPSTLRPSVLTLSASPNPFNPSTQIRFSLTQSGEVSLKVYDLAGRAVETLVARTLEAGDHAVTFEGNALPSGLYFARLQTAQKVMTQKLLLVK